MDCSQISDLEDAITEEFRADSESVLRLFCYRVFELIIDSRYPTSDSIKRSCDTYRSTRQSSNSDLWNAHLTESCSYTYEKFGVEAPLFGDIRFTLKRQLDRHKHVLDTPIILLTTVRMDDGDDLYLEAFWISLSSADGECRTVTVSDLYFRLCMVIRSVTVLVRMAPVRRLLTREWTETKHLFHHVIFSNTKALDNLHSLPGVRKISAILTPLGELQFGCVSRSHELTENDPWSKLHTSSHGLTEGALIDQMGNFLDYITVENCRQFSDTHRTVHTVLPKDLRTHHSELCPQQSDEVMHRIACPFATTPNPPEMLKKDEFHSLMAAPRLQAAMHTLSPSKESDRQITKSALRALQEQTSCENLPSASGLLFSPQFDITGLTDIAKLQHPVFPKTTASKLLRTVQTSWRPIEEQFRENQQFYEQFCCEIKEQPDASTSS